MIHRESADIYRSRKAVSAGFLWRLLQECPAQAWYESAFNDERPVPPHSDYFDVGQATHLLTLEGSEFAARATLIAYDSYRSQAARDLRDQAYIDGRTPLRPQDYELVTAMHRALRNSDAAELLFGDGQNEVSYTWEILSRGQQFQQGAYGWHQDSVAAGRPLATQCKARADRITPDVIIDLKTALLASTAAFQRAMVRDGHHLRAAWYLDGWNEQAMSLGKGFCNEYLFIVVAKTPPHLVAIYRIDERALAWGRTLYRKGLGLVRQALGDGSWQGYGAGEKIQNINLPAFAENLLIAQERNGEFDDEERDIPY